jgi:aspartate/glutamate racemase
MTRRRLTLNFECTITAISKVSRSLKGEGLESIILGCPDLQSLNLPSNELQNDDFQIMTEAR